MLRYISTLLLLLAISCGCLASDGARFLLTDTLELEAIEVERFIRETSPIRKATLLQPTPLLEPRVELLAPPPSASGPSQLVSQIFNSPGVNRSILRSAKQQSASFGVDVIQGAESRPLTSADIGGLLKKSTSALSTEVQSRTPIVHDPRIRSGRIGSLFASGSHWVAARADLDSAVSKIDSRLIDDVIVTPGPYSSVYGPGFHFVDFQLKKSPRSFNQPQPVGRSILDHNSNGNRWLAQQSLDYATRHWGVSASYVHRYGGDYRDGEGQPVASGYESRELVVAAGRDLDANRSIEFSLLRLDQTDVAFPGYVFDIDALVTDGYEVSYVDETPVFSDRLETEAWYNRTRFHGNAQGDRKDAQFTFLERINYVGFTDVDSLSTGYRQAMTWQDNRLYRVTLGHDLRFIKQELNEISSGTAFVVPLPFTDRNSPIPRSFSINPGLFVEYDEQLDKGWTIRTGGRLDYVQTDVVDERQKLDTIGLDFVPASYEEIVGTDSTQTDRALLSLFGSLDRQISQSLTAGASIGYAERVPTLTELYAAQPFLLMLQNGLNNVTGDPTLDKERLLQADLRFDFETDHVRAGARAFHSWAFDYVTFENTDTVGQVNQDAEQVSLRYVNTERATLVGGEAFAEFFPDAMLHPFATMRGVDGRDRTRRGDFATTNGANGSPSQKQFGQSRGLSSGVSGADSEPLPGISPFELTLGIKLRDPGSHPTWNVVISSRIVDNQDRVASSLLESQTPGFTIWDLRWMYQPRQSDRMLFVAGIENFTDKSYREHLDFRSFTGVPVLQPGINAYVGTDIAY